MRRGASASCPRMSRAPCRCVRSCSAPPSTGFGLARRPPPPTRSSATRSTSRVCARVSRKRFGNWRGTPRDGAIAIPWSTWRIRSDRRAGCERDHDPTGQLLPDRRRSMRRARQRLSRYHRLDPPSRSSAARSNGPSSMSAATTPNHRTAFIRVPRLWHADLGPLWDHTVCAMPNDLLFRERLERSQTADCHRRPTTAESSFGFTTPALHSALR